MADLNPRLVQAKTMHLVGLRRHYSGDDMDKVPGQWMEFLKQDVPNKVGKVGYGLVFDQPQGIDYMPAWQVAKAEALPKGFSATEMPAGQYAVFAHQGHMSAIHNTVDRIWREWVPTAKHKPLERPDTAYFFERYGEKFDPQKGEGDIEIWIPVKS